MGNESAQSAHVWRNPALPGVDMMRAQYTRHSFSRHFHEGYCLGVIEKGALAFRYRGENLVAPSGSVNLAVPGEVHDGQGADENGWAYRMFYLEPETVHRAARQVGCKEFTLPHFRPGVIRDASLAAGLAHLHATLEVNCSTLEAQTRFLSLLSGWIRRHADHCPNPVPTAPEHRAVATVRDVIQDRYAQDVSLEDLASEAALSPYHLARTFAEQIGMPPHAYLIQVRVERAVELLHGRDSIAQVATAVGFSDQSHLNRHFKRFKGVTPGAYRAAFRKNVQDR